MPHRRWLDRLADILDAANLLVTFGIDVDLVWQTANESAKVLAEQIRDVIDAETERNQ